MHNVRKIVQGHISVPSSSGKSLQLGKDGELETVRFNFSPLFIGEITSTHLRTVTCSLLKLYQSPLHRGNHFNFELFSLCFQSLSISVPSSSGKSLQQQFLSQRASINYISVPSSSGKSLQHL